nr:thioredoxin TrxC [Sinirhodobacter populi]
MMAETMRVTCLSCGQANRVPAERLAAGPKCGVCGAPLISAKPVAIDGAVLAKAAKDDLPLLVDFWAPWCGPCRQMAPQFEAAAGMLTPRVRFAKLNTEEDPAVSQRHGIQGIPAFILFGRGREVARAAGARPARDLVAFVQGKLGLAA